MDSLEEAETEEEEDSVITIKRSSSFTSSSPPQSIPPFISTDTTTTTTSNPIQLNLLVDSTPGKSMDDYFNSQTDDTKVFHMDFANRSIGGGVLGRGCVQEEIKFSVYTELIGVMILLLLLLGGKGELKDCEGLLVEGVSRYSITEGYGRQSFKFVSPCDRRQIRQNVLVLDAKDYSFTDSPLSQFTMKEINREILKLSAGLSLLTTTTTTTHSVQKRELVTGNWGCGAFGGNVQLKSLLQLMCAAEYGVDSVVYFTFGDQRFYDTESSGYDIHPLEFVYERIIKNRMTTKQLYDLLLEYTPSELSLFDYILSKTEYE
jgi:poly(ADP-ribose) glycohydrolase